MLLRPRAQPEAVCQKDPSPVSAAVTEALLDDGESAGSDLVSGEQAAWDPGGAAGIVGRPKGSAGDAADVVDQDIVIFRGALGVVDDALEDFEHLQRLDFQAGLFAHLADDALFQRFAGFEYSAGE